MQKNSANNLPQILQGRLKLVTFCLLACAVGGTAARAEDFQSQCTFRDDPNQPQWRWDNPHAWLNSAKANGVPSTAKDVGILSPEHRIDVERQPLGTDGNRPAIRLEPRSMLCVLNDLFNPVQLDGGDLDGLWINKSVQAPITVMADSLIQTSDDSGGPQMFLNGPITNTKPVTLRLAGGVVWQNDSSKTFTGTIAIERGAVLINVPAGSAALGTGPVILSNTARLWFQRADPQNQFVVSGTVMGNGSIQVTDANPANVATIVGATLHPGPPDHPGTLGINCSCNFQRSPAGQPSQLIVEVRGNTTDPAIEYGQLAIHGNLANTLNNLDIVVKLKPDVMAQQAAAMRLIVISAANAADMTKPQFAPVHAVTVSAGARSGTATATCRVDPLTGQGLVEITGITLK